MADAKTGHLKSPVDIAEYLFRRLKQVGINSVHGVPGDYNLVALDYVPQCGLEWVGNVNELNAAYAVDGYARVKGIGALVTTFGVGELSALNGIAGSFSEYVPVIHIVGTPSTISQANGMLLHHTLGNGDFKVFANMSREISCAVSLLTDPMTAAELIDQAIQECYIKSRPVYITLPTDNVTKKVEGERLKTPLDLNFPSNDLAKEDFVVNEVLSQLNSAKKPVILVDACTVRHRAIDEVHALVKSSGLPTFVAPMGKGAIDETLPNYAGVYAGDGSNKGVREIVEASDLILSIGAIMSDFNTAGFTYHTSTLSMIEFHSSYVQIKYAKYDGVRMHPVLKRITEKMPKFPAVSIPKTPEEKSVEDSQNEAITHRWFWPLLTNWVKEGDTIITETGTSGYGIWEVKFQKNTKAISQILWGSIGYAFGATQGAALAAKELGGNRTILFTGDGSFQLTAQELSTIIRHKLNPILVVVCNEGYTIERFIHGMKATYNDIGLWRFIDLPAAFGAEEGTYKTYQIKTKQDALSLLQDNDFADSPKLRLVELYMSKEDAPVPLRMTAEASARNNAQQ